MLGNLREFNAVCVFIICVLQVFKDIPDLQIIIIDLKY